MIRVLFICLGNICRSPMAEAIFKDLVRKEGLEDRIYCESAGTSCEEQGNPVYHQTASLLSKIGIDTSSKRARQLKQSDIDFDYLIAMDSSNVENTKRFFGQNKINHLHLLLDFANQHRSIADPYYTRDFQQTYDDVLLGCCALLTEIRKKV